MVICLEQGADLHMVQLMPLLLTVSCFSKIQIGFTFLVAAHRGSPGKRAIKRVCVYITKLNYICSIWSNAPHIHITFCSLIHTHTHLTALFPGLSRWAGTRKVTILLKQETASGNGISWAIYKSAPRSRQITMPTPTTQFLQAGCPFCHPTNSVKALQEISVV